MENVHQRFGLRGATLRRNRYAGGLLDGRLLLQAQAIRHYIQYGQAQGCVTGSQAQASRLVLSARRIAAGMLAAFTWASAQGQPLPAAPAGEPAVKRLPARQRVPQPAAVLQSGIGAEVQDVTPPIASSFGLGRATGALVVSIIQGSPAYTAGLQVGDVFLSIEDVTVRNAGHLAQQLASHAPGSIVTAQVWRDPYPIPLKINLPADKESVGSNEKTMPVSGPVAGLVVRELSHADLCQAGVENGLLVESAEGPAAAAGIRAGAVIMRANTAPLMRIEDLYAMLAARAGSQLALLVSQGGQAQFLSLAVPKKVK